MKISTITARMILDSRGNPTVEADITLSDGSFGRAGVPSGASTGSREAHELRDGNDAYGGLGVSTAIHNITTVISPAVATTEFASQKELDDYLCKLDGTRSKSQLGANAVLAVSLAFAKATAVSKQLPLYRYISEIAGNAKNTLPTPMFNVINGGKHALGSADIQEFMIVPVGISNFSEALRAGTEIFHTLGKMLTEAGHSTAVGDEGGYCLPPNTKNSGAIDLIVTAITQAGYTPGKDVSIALDVASSELYADALYILKAEGKSFTSAELINYYSDLVQKYPIISIEDGLDEDDWANWAKLNTELGEACMLVGDDLLVTNTTYIQQAIDTSACNAVLIKPNQIGTLSETIAAVHLAHDNSMSTVMSHRSGETEDTTIAHLSVGLGSKYIKSGSLSRSERLAKYNELLRISEQL